MKLLRFSIIGSALLLSTMAAGQKLIPDPDPEVQLCLVQNQCSCQQSLGFLRSTLRGSNTTLLEFEVSAARSEHVLHAEIEMTEPSAEPAVLNRFAHVRSALDLRFKSSKIPVQWKPQTIEDLDGRTRSSFQTFSLYPDGDQRVLVVWKRVESWENQILRATEAMLPLADFLPPWTEREVTFEARFLEGDWREFERGGFVVLQMDDRFAKRLEDDEMKVMRLKWLSNVYGVTHDLFPWDLDPSGFERMVASRIQLLNLPEFSGTRENLEFSGPQYLGQSSIRLRLMPRKAEIIDSYDSAPGDGASED